MARRLLCPACMGRLDPTAVWRERGDEDAALTAATTKLGWMIAAAILTTVLFCGVILQGARSADATVSAAATASAAPAATEVGARGPVTRADEAR